MKSRFIILQKLKYVTIGKYETSFTYYHSNGHRIIHIPQASMSQPLTRSAHRLVDEAPHSTHIPSSPDISPSRRLTGSVRSKQNGEKKACTPAPAIQTQSSITSCENRLPTPKRAGYWGEGECRRLWVQFVLSRGYTEQQEWVWSLSSTLGRENAVIGSNEDRVRRGKEDEM